MNYLDWVEKNKKGKKVEEIYYLNDKQRALINMGKQQTSNGEYISHEELEKEEDEWLNK